MTNFRTTLLFGLTLTTSLALVTACGNDRKEDREEEREVRGENNQGSNGAGGLGDLFGSPSPDSPSPDSPSPDSPSPDSPSPDSPSPDSPSPDSPSPDSSTLCIPENHCTVVDNVATCDEGYVYAIESDDDLSCRLPNRLETQKAWFSCTNGAVEWVTLQAGEYAAYEASSDTAVQSGFFRIAEGGALRFHPLYGPNAGVTIFADEHFIWDGMSDRFFTTEFGNCVLETTVESIAGQWFYEDDTCTGGACSFIDNTFFTTDDGFVSWHVTKDLSYESFSDTESWTRSGRARMDADGYVNFTFPAFDDEPETQFVGAMDADGDIYDVVREEWLYRQ